MIILSYNLDVIQSWHIKFSIYYYTLTYVFIILSYKFILFPPKVAYYWRNLLSSVAHFFTKPSHFQTDKSDNFLHFRSGLDFADSQHTDERMTTKCCLEVSLLSGTVFICLMQTADNFGFAVRGKRCAVRILWLCRLVCGWLRIRWCYNYISVKINR
jgi:hypothetical protein